MQGYYTKHKIQTKKARYARILYNQFGYIEPIDNTLCV